MGFAQNKTHALDPLLVELRQDLRKELNLEPVETTLKYLRILLFIKGGRNNKKDGRIGDTPLIACGTWADNETCGVSGTGDGEVK